MVALILRFSPESRNFVAVVQVWPSILVVDLHAAMVMLAFEGVSSELEPRKMEPGTGSGPRWGVWAVSKGQNA